MFQRTPGFRNECTTEAGAWQEIADVDADACERAVTPAALSAQGSLDLECWLQTLLLMPGRPSGLR